MSRWVVLGLDVALWGTIHAGFGYLAYRFSDPFLDRDRWLWRERRVERGGRLYVRVFRINRWKHKLPEAGAIFAGGYDKRSVGGRSDEALARYVRESRRAETAHWAMAACLPIFFTFNPWPADVLLTVYAVTVNGPCIVALRANRLRITRILDRRAARAARHPSP